MNMKKIGVYSMALVMGSLAFSCTQSGTEQAGYQSADKMREQTIALEAPKALKAPGKIYIKDDMLLINEVGKGIHVVNNQNPQEPEKLAFIKIPGNIDVAVKGDLIYADNYMDLVVLNSKTGEIKRVKDVFKTFEKQRRKEMLALGGAEGMMDGIRGTQFQAVSNGAPAGGSPVGIGGSMARFSIVDNHLYVLDGDKMLVYDIENPDQPKKVNTIAMDFNVETIFPHEGQLFIGGTEGMYIYDNSNPAAPQFLSRFNHAVACDPVVVDGDFAYITLRNGGPCDRAVNRLEVVNVEDLTNPTLVKNFNMNNPHGLSVQNNTLYLCDGNQGLKVFDVTEKDKISDNLRYADPKIRKAYDVIPNNANGTLIVVGKEGIFQYDAMDPIRLQRLSTIAIEA